MTTITITRALTRIKVINSQLDNLAGQGNFVRSALADNVTDKANEQFKTKSQSNFDTFKDLVKESEKLQLAIRKSNLEKVVTISGEEMTVSQALIRKDLMAYRSQLLSQIRKENSKVESEIEKSNSLIEGKAQDFVAKLNGDSVQLESALELARNSAIKELKRIKLAGFNVEDYLETETKAVEGFIAEVDYVLSESNATTFIEV